jgi:hypothetical protein
MARKIGLRFKENMYGHYEVLEGPEAGKERHFVFHWVVDSPGLIMTLRGGRTAATGWVEAEGLAGRADLEGWFVLRPVVQRFIRYEFTFTGDDGRRYRFEGQKTLRHLHPARTWTTLPGVIYDDQGKEWARSLSRFHFRELHHLLFSIRFPLVKV